MPADGNRAANVGTGDFGTSPIFVQLSDKPLLASVWLFGVWEPKAQWRVQKLRAADSMNGVVPYWAPLNKANNAQIAKDCGEQFYTDATPHRS
jgi:hypothetical protein